MKTSVLPNPAIWQLTKNGANVAVTAQTWISATELMLTTTSYPTALKGWELTALHVDQDVKSIAGYAMKTFGPLSGTFAK
jgi:hypothetical protein